MRRLFRILAVIPIALLLSDAGLAQDDSAPEADASEVDTAADAGETPDGDSAEDTAKDTDVVEIDDESYRDTENDDFRPSEEIPADQSITFPTDI